MRRSILSKGIPAERLMVGAGVYSKYYPVSNENTKYEITHAQALDITADNNAYVQWVETNDIGIIREQFVDTGAGHIWMHDGNTLRHNLDLVDKYGLHGATLFILDAESEDIWNVISAWGGQP